MPLVSIKVDNIAALRLIKRLKEPDPSHAAVLAEIAGADGITCHLREDRRYIRDRDLYILKEVVNSKLTVQISPVEELIERAIEVKPWMVTLMPPTNDDTVVGSGINLDADRDLYADTALNLKGAGINVAYFVDPDIDAVKGAARAKADAVELNTGDYVRAGTIDSAEEELDRLEQMARLAAKLGLMANCGGGLNYRNIRPLTELGVFEEFTIGHAAVARALMVGVERAVRELVEIIHLPSDGGS